MPIYELLNPNQTAETITRYGGPYHTGPLENPDRISDAPDDVEPYYRLIGQIEQEVRRKIREDKRWIAVAANLQKAAADAQELEHEEK